MTVTGADGDYQKSFTMTVHVLSRTTPDAGPVGDAGPPDAATPGPDASGADAGPSGPNLVTCRCTDSTMIPLCSDKDCLDSIPLYQLCDTACAANGGVFTLPGCETNAPACG